MVAIRLPLFFGNIQNKFCHCLNPDAPDEKDLPDYAEIPGKATLCLACDLAVTLVYYMGGVSGCIFPINSSFLYRLEYVISSLSSASFAILRMTFFKDSTTPLLDELSKTDELEVSALELGTSELRLAVTLDKEPPSTLDEEPSLD